MYLCTFIASLLDGKALTTCSEDLNALVRRHIQTVLAVSPSKTLSTLETDARELIAAGMVTLNAKLANIPDDILLNRVIEIWGFFWDQILPYIEGVSYLTQFWLIFLILRLLSGPLTLTNGFFSYLVAPNTKATSDVFTYTTNDWLVFAIIAISDDRCP